jgi:hypothetical protein
LKKTYKFNSLKQSHFVQYANKLLYLETTMM